VVAIDAVKEPAHSNAGGEVTLEVLGGGLVGSGVLGVVYGFGLHGRSEGAPSTVACLLASQPASLSSLSQLLHTSTPAPACRAPDFQSEPSRVSTEHCEFNARAQANQRT